MDGQPVKGLEDECIMIMFTPPRQDPGSAVLNVLELLEAPARSSNKEGITVVQPGRDKGMDQLLSITEREGRAEFGNIPQMVEGSFTE